MTPVHGKFSGGGGTIELPNAPQWERKKTANTPSSIHTAAVFIARTVEWCHFKHFNVPKLRILRKCVFTEATYG